MFKPHIGICKGCSHKAMIVTKIRSLCQYCDKKAKGYKPLRLTRKTTGEAALFKAIWFDTEIPHNCVDCGVFIREPTAGNFSHEKPKGRFPEMRLVKANIKLRCWNCHKKHDGL